MAELQQRHPVEIVWLPFELRPEPEPLPEMTGATLARYRANWERGAGLLAARYGVEMHFPLVKPRSRWAHEAAEYARDRGQFDAMRLGLFRAYFVEGRDLGQPDVLVDVAARIGLDGADLRVALETGRYTERVRELEQIPARLGISAVPTMIFGDTVAVQGAQPYAVLREAYEMAEREARGAAPP